MFARVVCHQCPKSGPAFKLPITTKRTTVTKCTQRHDVALVFQTSGWALPFERTLRRVATDQPRDAVLVASMVQLRDYLGGRGLKVRIPRPSAT
jgi:hypothetical protein